MNYLKVYKDLCKEYKLKYSFPKKDTKSLSSYNKLIKNKYKNDYVEIHHIKPICLGGDKHSWNNLVVMTSKAHYIAHWLLTKIYKNNHLITYAFWMMHFSNNNKGMKRHKTSIGYSMAKKNIVKFMKNRKAEDHPSFQNGKLWTKPIVIDNI